MNLSILYRGALSSCNYGCGYCPFAKKVETKAEHEHDRVQLDAFVNRVAELSHRTISIFFTPWGEALIHPRYQRAIVALTHMPHVNKVAIQTNLSCSLRWIDNCEVSKLGLWATYHPGETVQDQFVGTCLSLDKMQVRYSVGIVGLKEHFNAITEIRKALHPNVYLWINAYKRVSDYYCESDRRFLESIDPLFSFNNNYHDSIGRACRCGDTVISVDGSGDIRRCHFIPDVVGNLYADNFEGALRATPCTAAKCGCHIGYVHMNDLPLYDVFGAGVLERIPETT
ncbi:MAG: STM4011 family radical SAM protein [Candidatus Obscuribacterales bacterium]|nr:STM4011 family radical SAM protein [Candidatus Obscuribacterales bacterium]